MWQSVAQHFIFFCSVFFMSNPQISYSHVTMWKCLPFYWCSGGDHLPWNYLNAFSLFTKVMSNKVVAVFLKCSMAILICSIATPTELCNLVKFWTGWEVLPNNISVEVVNGTFPKGSTCFETLRLPSHYQDYKSFKDDLVSCVRTHNTGFGLV